MTDASGLRSSSQHVSVGPVPRAAGIGCARDSHSQGLPADGQGNAEPDFTMLKSSIRMEIRFKTSFTTKMIVY